jgi:Ulp1 family protease
MDGWMGEQFPKKLAPELEVKVNDLFNRRTFKSTIRGAEVIDKDLVKLKPRTWLNDEVRFGVFCLPASCLFG